MTTRVTRTLIVAAATLAVAFSGRLAERKDHAPLRAAAIAFLDGLSADHRAQASFAFDDPLRLDWHFIPRDRKGLPLAAMDAGERRLAHALLRAGLSSQGYLKTLGVLELEEVLREEERAAGRDGAFRDREKYYFSVFGDPRGEAPFLVRFEGHHLALHWSSVPAEGTVVTPAFFGANPAEVRTGPRTGVRLLAVEEDVSRELVRSLTTEQRKKAVIAAQAPADVLFGPGKAADPGRFEGLAAAEMSAAQQELLLRLVGEFLNDFEPAIARERRASLLAADTARIHFAWAGSLGPGEGHYWRAHGPGFVIEYDNTQNDASHVHLLWRDPKNDFAAEWLARHHAAEHQDGAGR